jgi:hypothetical protein
VRSYANTNSIKYDVITKYAEEVLGLVRPETEEDLGNDVVDQRAWHHHGGALVVLGGDWGRSGEARPEPSYSLRFKI